MMAEIDIRQATLAWLSVLILGILGGMALPDHASLGEAAAKQAADYIESRPNPARPESTVAEPPPTTAPPEDDGPLLTAVPDVRPVGVRPRTAQEVIIHSLFRSPATVAQRERSTSLPTIADIFDQTPDTVAAPPRNPGTTVTIPEPTRPHPPTTVPGQGGGEDPPTTHPPTTDPPVTHPPTTDPPVTEPPPTTEPPTTEPPPTTTTTTEPDPPVTVTELPPETVPVTETPLTSIPG